MAAYRRVYDSRHLQADCKEPESDPEPYARQSSLGHLYLLPTDPRLGPAVTYWRPKRPLATSTVATAWFLRAVRRC